MKIRLRRRLPPFKGDVLLSAFLYFVLFLSDAFGSWEEWWNYDGISGPEFWGLINPQWNLCNKGRQQSPINIEPGTLLFDPGLRPLHIDKHPISGTLNNTGQSLVFKIGQSSKIQPINITGGPLAYRYQFDEMYIHFGMENHYGSEHTIHGTSFPLELQLYGFNSELYHNMSEARYKANGIVAVSIMVQVGDSPNNELRYLTTALNHITYRGSSVPIKHLSLRGLLPNTQYFLTYEGSTTHPGCWETTTWIIINKPIYISKQEIYGIRKLMQGTEDQPKGPLGNNIRPVQNLNARTVSTNIDFTNAVEKGCPTMKKETFYRSNIWNTS